MKLKHCACCQGGHGGSAAGQGPARSQRSQHTAPLQHGQTALKLSMAGCTHSTAGNRPQKSLCLSLNAGSTRLQAPQHTASRRTHTAQRCFSVGGQVPHLPAALGQAPQEFCFGWNNCCWLQAAELQQSLAVSQEQGIQFASLTLPAKQGARTALPSDCPTTSRSASCVSVIPQPHSTVIKHCFG